MQPEGTLAHASSCWVSALCVLAITAPCALRLALGCPSPGSDSAAPAGSQPLHRLYCSTALRSSGALQSHVSSQQVTQTDSTFTCELCGELFLSQGKLVGHLSTEHHKVAFCQATTAQIVQVRIALCHSRCSCSSILLSHPLTLPKSTLWALSPLLLPDFPFLEGSMMQTPNPQCSGISVLA